MRLFEGDSSVKWKGVGWPNLMFSFLFGISMGFSIEKYVK